MKIEKLNENKIRIILSSQDLIEKNIDFNSFMSNSIETQDLFFDMLEEAEEKVGFVTRDHKIKIEALALAGGEFVLTITKYGKQSDADTHLVTKQKNIKAKRITNKLNQDILIYSFKTFDDFCLFSSNINRLKNINNIAKNIVLYTYNSQYYLQLTKPNIENPSLKTIGTIITEYGSYIRNSNLFSYKLSERGKIILKHNAIKQCIKYFG